MFIGLGRIVIRRVILLSLNVTMDAIVIVLKEVEKKCGYIEELHVRYQKTSKILGKDGHAKFEQSNNRPRR